MKRSEHVDATHERVGSEMVLIRDVFNKFLVCAAGPIIVGGRLQWEF